MTDFKALLLGQLFIILLGLAGYMFASTVFAASGNIPKGELDEGSSDLIFGGWSQHTDREYAGACGDSKGGLCVYNEEHMGFGVEHNNFFAIGFRNSYNQDSLAFGKAKQVLSYRGADLRLLYGLVSGYKRNPVPIILPTLDVPVTRRIKLTVGSVGVVSAIYIKMEI